MSYCDEMGYTMLASLVRSQKTYAARRTCRYMMWMNGEGRRSNMRNRDPQSGIPGSTYLLLLKMILIPRNVIKDGAVLFEENSFSQS